MFGSTRKSAAILLSVALAASALAGALPASANGATGNDPFTHIDENFNTTGFAAFAAGPDYVRVVGTLEFSTYEATNRRFSISIEGTSDATTHKAVLRAYKPADATGSYGSWAGTAPTSPVHGFVLDTTFGTEGVLEILDPAGAPITGVTSVAQQRRPLSSSSTLASGNDQISVDSNLTPSLLVVAGSSSYVIRLDHSSLAPGGLGVCSTVCKQHALDVTAAIANVAGPEAVLSGFAQLATATNSEQFTEAYVSGRKSDGTLFIAKLHLGVFLKTAKSEWTPGVRRYENYQNGAYALNLDLSGASSVGAVVTVASTSSIEVGMTVTKSSGTGTLEADTRVESVDSATTFTLDKAPSLDISAANLDLKDTFSVTGVNPADYNFSNVAINRRSDFLFEMAGSELPTYVSGGIVVRSNGLGRSAGFLSNYVEIPSSDFASGDYSALTTFTPIENSLVRVGTGASGVLLIAGNISNETKSIGVLLRREMGSSSGDELRPHATQPVTHFDIGTANTELGFVSGSTVLGGSYQDSEGRAKPLMIYSTNNSPSFSTYISHKLPVDSLGDEKLLATRVSANSSGSALMKAVASDGEGLRVYTWASMPTVSNTPASETSRQTFGLTGAEPTSAIISSATNENSSLGNGMISFTGFSKAAGAKIVAAQFQSRLPAYITAPALILSGGWLRLVPPGSTQMLGLYPTSSYYSCTSALEAGSALTTSTISTPAGCTEIAGLAISSEDVRIDTGNNKSLLVGHVIRKITHTSPDFVYWTNSVEFGAGGGTDDSDEDTGGSGDSTPSNPAPSTLGGGGATSALISSNLQAAIQKVAGAAGAGSIVGGVLTPIDTDIVRVTATTVADIRTEALAMKTGFDNAWDGTGTNSSPKITVVNTPTGASVFGLIKNPNTNQPIGVPAQDVVLIKTPNEAIMLAAAETNQPARINARGVLVINNGGLVGAAANGFSPNTAGELAIMSTPTTLGTFTTDANGSFSGQALLPAGLENGDHTVVLVTASLSTSLGVTVEPAAGGPAAVYAGPVLPLAKAVAAASGATITLAGQKLETVTDVFIGSTKAQLISASAAQIQIKLPTLAVGSYDLVLVSGFGRITIQGAIMITSATATAQLGVGQGLWTRAEVGPTGAITTVKMYAKNPVGMGKVQFKVNGKEIAWLKAVDATDPKLRSVNSGSMAGNSYLVRTVTLTPGKNALEIYVDGKRVWRAAYAGN